MEYFLWYEILPKREVEINFIQAVIPREAQAVLPGQREIFLLGLVY